MKIMLPVKTDKGLDAELDGRFGRADYFLFYDTESENLLCQPNSFKDEAQGVGIKASSFVVEQGCRLVIGARPGPKAAAILADANIEVVVAENLTAGEAIRNHLAG